MAVLVYVETDSKGIKSSSLEAVAMASSLAKDLEKKLIGVSFDENVGLDSLGGYGITKVYHASNEQIKEKNIRSFSKGVEQVMKATASEVLVMPNTSLCEASISRIAIDLDASVKTNVIGKPDTSNGFQVIKDAYTGKAFAHYQLRKPIKLITIKKSSFDFTPQHETNEVVDFDLDLSSIDVKIKIKNTKYTEGDILLTEADLVVSAGRGLKGAENWGIVEELAKTLGAATACSKPVADIGWRPHYEHVGQTGVKVSPNLYIALGISGAIQHLAGVSSSKTIVVINTDAEAPFFKAADYGIVGDVFEVVPKLTEMLKS